MLDLLYLLLALAFFAFGWWFIGFADRLKGGGA